MMPWGAASAFGRNVAKDGGSGSAQPWVILFLMFSTKTSLSSVDLWFRYVRAAFRSAILSSSEMGFRGEVDPDPILSAVWCQIGWRCIRGWRHQTGRNSDP